MTFAEFFMHPILWPGTCLLVGVGALICVEVFLISKQGGK